ncbi:hypothetical protein ES703_67480 [subsurface metagenome]
MVHKISIESICESRAKLLRRKTKRFLFGSSYDITFKMKNLGEKDFLGGKAMVLLKYTSGIVHSIGLDVPKIEKGGEILIPPKNSPKRIIKSAVGKGYALFFGRMTTNNSESVQLIKYGQELPENASFGAIRIETREDFYSYYSLIISACALVTLVILSILQLIF